jgi:FtsH-binding integral membrane protein
MLAVLASGSSTTAGFPKDSFPRSTVLVVVLVPFWIVVLVVGVTGSVVLTSVLESSWLDEAGLTVVTVTGLTVVVVTSLVGVETFRAMMYPAV